MFDRSRWLAALLAIGVSHFHVCAQTEETTTGNQLMFVPPPVEGALSLGIYDSRGKLVRVLKKSASIDSFKSGLNGLFVEWDRNDSQGKPTPPGRYYARGVLIGDVKIEGIAFHLNDWVDRTGQTRFSHIAGLALLSDLHPVVIADAPTRQLLVFDSKTAAAKSVPINFNVQSIKPSESNLLLFDNAQIAIIDQTGNMLYQRALPDIKDADAFGSRNVILSGSELSDQSGTAPPQQIKLPEENIPHCTILQSAVLVANKASKVWKLDQQNFIPIDIGETGELLDMEAGVGDTAWVLVHTASATLVKQIDITGKSLRDIELPADLASSTRLAASRQQDALLLISNDGPMQRSVGLKFQTADQGKSVWEKWLDRSVTGFQYFDLREGRVVPSPTRTESPVVFVKPANNPLDNARQPNFQLSVYADETGAWVANADGLPLFQVCKTKGIKQTRFQSDNANGMRAYISDGIVVEEYHLTGLDNLFRFDAGSFD
jgi:hypothetical protein